MNKWFIALSFVVLCSVGLVVRATTCGRNTDETAELNCEQGGGSSCTGGCQWYIYAYCCDSTSVCDPDDCEVSDFEDDALVFYWKECKQNYPSCDGCESELQDPQYGYLVTACSCQ